MTTNDGVLYGGRARQKLRTRNALVAAARELVARGETPTVESAAEAAQISRTTAYRYFRNQAELLAAAHPEIRQTSFLPADAPADPARRLELVVNGFTRIIVDTEPQQRTMLRLSLEPRAEGSGPLLLRQGRAIAWIDEALAPLRGTLSKAELRRLVLAIRTTVGIEALVWLTDVAGLSREEAAKNMRWAASALLAAATTPTATKPTKPTTTRATAPSSSSSPPQPGRESDRDRRSGGSNRSGGATRGGATPSR